MSDAPEFTVMGAGLAGPLAAALLAGRGYRTRLYEMRADPRGSGAGEGRSINLALSNRGLEALGRVGIADRVREGTIPMRGRMMHDRGGGLTFQPYGTEAHHLLYSVSRHRLNCDLLDALDEREAAEVVFGHKCTAVDLEAGTARFHDAAAGDDVSVETGRIVAADGAFSRVRSEMARAPRFDYSQSYLGHGYKELSMPPGPDGDFALEPNALHIWPRRSFMMIALPNADRTFTCTLFWPFAGPVSFDRVRTTAELETVFAREFPDVPALIPDLAGQFDRNPVGSLVTVRCYPWSEGDRAVLVGDAAHAVVPFYGQGMNCAFEDCSVLDDCIHRHASDWRTVFSTYERSRKENADALADLALENFVEMRDHTGSRRFLLRKAWERLLARLLPGWYVPLYSMVSFTSIPYAEARRRARRQDRTVNVAVGILAAAVVLLLILLFS